MTRYFIYPLLIISTILYGDEPVAVYNITLSADEFVTPNISPDNKYIFIIGTTETEKYLVICFMHDGKYYRLIDRNKSRQKSKGRGKRIRRINREEKIIGWIMHGGLHYLYTATDEIKSETETVTVFYEHGEEPTNYNRYFDSQSPNKPDVTHINSDGGYAWVSFINGLRGLYKIDLKKNTLPLSKEPIVRTGSMVQGLSAWFGRELLLAGGENIYEFFEIKKNKASLINIDLAQYTIMRDLSCHKSRDGIFSFIGSNADYQESDKHGDLCIYDLNHNKYIDKIDVYFDDEAYSGNRFSQWAPTKDKLYFLKKNGDEINLYYYNYLNAKVSPAGINEKKVKSFAVSNDGQFCVILRDTNTDQVIVYKLND